MIGISQIKKRLFIGIAIGAGVGVVGIILTLLWATSTVKTYENGTNKNYLAKYTVEVTTFNRDVLQGETVTADMLTPVRVHISTQPKDAYLGSAIGKIVKYNVSKNVPITANMIADNVIATDVRIQEISQIMLPTDVKEKDFVDFRLKMPSGVEYVVMAQKQIQKIIGNTMWLNLSEEEIHIINAATVDAYSNPGIVFYAVQYTDPQTQIKIDDKATAAKAKDFLAMKILDDVKAGNIPAKEPATATTKTTDANGAVVEKANTEYVDFKDKIAALLLKYAVDYRYYVESYNKVVANYQPNTTVMAYMKENKNIVDEAKNKLSEEARTAMTVRNSIFEEANKDKIGAIVSGAQAAASAQKGMRSSTLAKQ